MVVTEGVLINTDEDSAILVLTSKKQVLELRELCHRGMNTWDKCPKWAFELADSIDSSRGKEIPPITAPKRDEDGFLL